VSDTYQIGDAVRVTCSFRALGSGVLDDPTTVTVKTKVHKTGAVTTFVHGSDAQVVRDAEGVFHFDFVFAESGTHYLRFVGTGDVKAATPDLKFEVSPSVFEVA
jgi:hypothetical protein